MQIKDPAGDLLREEQNRNGSQYGELIRNCIQEGALVPSHVTMKLLENAMTEALKKRTGDGWTDGKGRFLIDGFPRKMDQALAFDETVRHDLYFLYMSQCRFNTISCALPRWSSSSTRPKR